MRRSRRSSRPPERRDAEESSSTIARGRQNPQKEEEEVDDVEKEAERGPDGIAFLVSRVKDPRGVVEDVSAEEQNPDAGDREMEHLRAQEQAQQARPQDHP